MHFCAWWKATRIKLSINTGLVHSETETWTFTAHTADNKVHLQRFAVHEQLLYIDSNWACWISFLYSETATMDVVIHVQQSCLCSNNFLSECVAVQTGYRV